MQTRYSGNARFRRPLKFSLNTSSHAHIDRDRPSSNYYPSSHTHSTRPNSTTQSLADILKSSQKCIIRDITSSFHSDIHVRLIVPLLHASLSDFEKTHQHHQRSLITTNTAHSNRSRSLFDDRDGGDRGENVVREGTAAGNGIGGEERVVSTLDASFKAIQAQLVQMQVKRMQRFRGTPQKIRTGWNLRKKLWGPQEKY